MKKIEVSKKVRLLLAGIVLGLLCVILDIAGNPKNMAICVACFIRDTAGALKFHTADSFQYIRPEITGIVLGSCIMALVRKEFHCTSGSSVMIRFLLGMITMVGALVFLGCPLRMVLRMAGGDLNAYVGLIGFILGCSAGAICLKKGFSLGRSYEISRVNGFILPALLLAFVVLNVLLPVFAKSTNGPGSIHAPVLLSLIVSIVFGAVSQKARTCFAGGIRDIILMKNFDLLLIIAALGGTMMIYQICTGGFSFSFTNQFAAHSEWLWNLLPMFIVGLSAVLAGGCPLRQLVMAGQGSCDSAVYLIGMLIGAAVCHNFSIASSGKGATPSGRGACIVCLILLGILIPLQINKKKSKG